MTTSTNSRPHLTASWRHPGSWLALVAAAVLLVNVVRAVADPVAFADYLGLSPEVGPTRWIDARRSNRPGRRAEPRSTSPCPLVAPAR